MSNIHHRIEFTANVLIIVVALLIIGVLIQRYKSPSPQAPQTKAPAIGSKVSLPDLDLSKSNKNLLLVLQKGCHFCTESADFYKKLIVEAKSRNVKIFAVLPQNREEAEGYLNSLGIQGIEIQQSRLDSLKVGGTPTIMLVNDKAEVMNLWVGKLPTEKEQEVFGKLS